MAHFAKFPAKSSLVLALAVGAVLSFSWWRLHAIDARARAQIEQLLHDATGAHAQVADAEVDLTGWHLIAHGVELDEAGRSLLKDAELSLTVSWRALVRGRLELQAFELRARSLRLNGRDLRRISQRMLDTSTLDRLSLRVDRVEIALAEGRDLTFAQATWRLDGRRFQLQADDAVWHESGAPRASADVRAHGTLRDRAQLDADLQLTKLRVRDRAFDEALALHVVSDGNQLRVAGAIRFDRKPASEYALEWPIDSSLALDPSRFALRARARRAPIAPALALLGVSSLERALAGSLDGTLELSGTLAPLALNGTAQFDAQALRIGDALLRIPQLSAASELRIDRSGTHLDDLRVKLPNGKLGGDASVDSAAELALSLSGDDVSLADLDRIAGVAVVGRGHVSIRASGPLASPDLHAELALAQAKLAGFDLGKLDAAFDLRDHGQLLSLAHAEISDPQRRLAVDDLPLHFDGGLAEAHARLKVARLPLTELYRVLGAADDALLQRLQADTAGEVEVSFRRAANDHPLTLALDLRLRDVALAGYRFERGQLRAKVAMPIGASGLGGGVLTLEQMSLAADGGRLELSGDMRRGALAMRIALQRLPLERDAWLHAHLTGITGRVDGSGSLSGDASSTKADLALALDDLKLAGSALGHLQLRALLRDRSQLTAADTSCASRPLASGPSWLVCGGGARDPIEIDLAIGTGPGFPVRGRIALHDFALGGFLPASEASAHMAGTLTGALTLDGGGLDDLDRLSGRFAVQRLAIGAGETAIANAGPIALDIEAGKLAIGEAVLEGPTQRYQLHANGSLGRDARLLADGRFAASLLTRRSEPVVEAYGEVGVHLEWHPWSSEHGALSGRADLQKVQLRIGAQTVLREIGGALELSGEQLHVASLRAALGGGHLQLDGQLGLRGLRVANYGLKLTAAKVALEPQPHVELLVDADTQLDWSGGDALPRLSGDVLLKRALYGRQIGIEAISALGRDHAEHSARERVAIDVRLHQESPLRVRNDFLDGEVTMSGPDHTLHLVGTDRQLGMTGQLSIARGRVLFYGDQFHVTHGEISFADQQRIAPHFDLRAVAERPKRPDTSIEFHAHGSREAFDVAVRCDAQGASEPPPFTCNYAHDHMRCDSFEQLVALWVCRSKPTMSRAERTNDAQK
ncbi:MAG TPA: translocation/assembly module TamB domain-containing protein [Polyangiales bacterium]